MNIFNSQMTHTEFLRDYWNKKPCLFKNAFPKADELATKEDFLELATGEFETRLVTMVDGKRKLQDGPFKMSSLINQMEKDHTLICHNLNTLSEEFYELEKSVSFLPKWEFDDVMATVSNKGMSLGAHIDDYNVFIFQGRGKRSWEIQLNPTHGFKEDEEIKVLKEFNPDFVWDLEPGDMIYIPPHVAHHGISTEDSISYSIGFSAIDTARLYQRFIAYNLLNDLPKQIYNTVPLELDDLNSVPSDLAANLQKSFSSSLFDQEEFYKWLVKELSQTKNSEEQTLEESNEVNPNYGFYRDSELKFCYMPFKEDYILGINQRDYIVNKNELEYLVSIFSNSPFIEFQLKENNSKSLQVIISDLIGFGDIFQEIET